VLQVSGNRVGEGEPRQPCPRPPAPVRHGRLGDALDYSVCSRASSLANMSLRDALV
jgi:hypothetical protein